MRIEKKNTYEKKHGRKEGGRGGEGTLIQLGNQQKWRFHYLGLISVVAREG